MNLRQRLALLAIISLLSMTFATWLWLGKVQHETEVYKFQSQQSHQIHVCATLLHYLQRERGYSTSSLVNNQYDETLLAHYRKDTDDALNELLVQPFTTSNRLNKGSLTSLTQMISDARLRSSGHRPGWQDVRDSYTEIVNELFSVIQVELVRQADLGFTSNRIRLSALVRLTHARESMGLLRATVNAVKQGGAEIPHNDLAFITTQYALYQDHLRSLDEVLENDMTVQLQHLQAGAEHQWVIALLEELVQTGKLPNELDIGDKWWRNTSSIIDMEKGIEDKAYDDMEHQISEKISRQVQYMYAMEWGAGILIIGLGTLVWLTIRRMLRDLIVLSNGLHAVVKDENYTVRLPGDLRNDEFGQVFNLFNQLLGFTDSLLREKEKLATQDPLTGIMNRRSLRNFAQREISRASRHSQPLSLIFLDIDHFKRVNDTYGHNVGDDVLQTFAKVIKEHSRETDILARWGGEEFIVLAPNSDVDGTRTLAEHLREAIATTHFHVVEKATCSLGVAQWRKGETFESLCTRADVALYKAKEGGRNQVCIDGQALVN